MDYVDEGSPEEVQEPVTPEVESYEEPENETESETAESGENTEADESSEDAEEFEDDGTEPLNFNGTEYKLPKDIAAGVKSMQKDYTQKTMALADERRAFQAQAQVQQALRADYDQLSALNSRVNEFQNIDWNTLAKTDHALALQLMADSRNVESQRNQLMQQISYKDQQLQQHQAQETARLVMSSEAILKRDIKDWSPQLENQLVEFALEMGFDLEDVKKSKVDPRLYKLLHEAHQGRQIMKKMAASKAPKIVQHAKPVTTLKAKGAKPAPNPATMTMAQYREYRKKGI